MKTIYIINDLIQGGSTKSLLRIISSSNKENIIITLDPNSVSADFLNNDYKIYSLNFKTIIDFIKSFFKVKSILKNKKNYTLHCWLYKSCLIGWLIALINGNKSLIWNIRHADTEFNFLKLDSYLNLKYTKKHFIIRILGIISRLKIKKISIVFNSNFSKKKHLKIGYSSKNSFVITNGFNTDIYKNSTLQKNLFLEKYYIDKNLFLISMYARFHPIKNHEILFKAVSKLISKHHKIHIFLAGRNINKNNKKLQKLISFYDLNKYITLGGLLSEEELIGSYSATDLTILTSISESFPNVIGESMSCMTPCLSFDVGDCKEIIGNSGWVAEKNNLNSLVFKIEEILASFSKNNLWAKIRISCREHIRKIHSLEIEIKKYQALEKNMH